MTVQSQAGGEQSIAKQETGIIGLDEVLHGGLPQGRVTVLSGGHGTGKTVLTLECLYRQASAGVPALFVTFEESAASIRENVLAMGWDLQRLHDGNRLAILAIDLPPAMVLSGDFSLDGALAIIRQKCEEMGARLLVLDAADWLLNLFDDSQRRSKHLLALHAALRDQKLTTIITVKEHEPDASILDYIADCVIRLDQRVENQINTRRLRVSKYRGSGYQSNEHPFLITTDGAKLLPVSGFELAYTAPSERISSGHATLDEMLAGGYFKGACVLIAGASGTGKTTWASTFAAGACSAGDRVLYVTYEESQDSLIQAMRSPGLELRKHVDSKQLEIMSHFPESMGPDLHLLVVVNAIERSNPDHIVIDAVSALERMGSAQAAFDFQVRLIALCKNRGITCILTSQARTWDITREMGHLEISSLVECVLALEQRWTSRGFQRYLAVIKSRGTVHTNGLFPFQITSHGFQIGVPSGQDGTAPTSFAGEEGGSE